MSFIKKDYNDIISIIKEQILNMFPNATVFIENDPNYDIQSDFIRSSDSKKFIYDKDKKSENNLIFYYIFNTKNIESLFEVCQVSVNYIAGVGLYTPTLTIRETILKHMNSDKIERIRKLCTSKDLEIFDALVNKWTYKPKLHVHERVGIGFIYYTINKAGEIITRVEQRTLENDLDFTLGRYFRTKQAAEKELNDTKVFYDRS